MSDEAEIEVQWKPVGKVGVGVLVVNHPDGSYTDKFDVTKSSERKRIAHEVVEKLPGVSSVDLERRLEECAIGAVECEGGHEESDSQADLLVAMVRDERVELHHTAGGNDSEAHASIQVGKHRETWAVRSRGFDRWLVSSFLRLHGKAPNAQALGTAIGTIEALAVFDGPEHDVFVRVAGDGDRTWIDLGGSTWSAVCISAEGYKVVESKDVAVRFIRPSGMLALPEPVSGGALEGLRALINLSASDDWILFKAWLVMAMHPKGDHPILAVDGPEGSAKTSFCRLARGVVDPNIAALRRPPREELDLVIAASNAWVVGFDNFSSISERLSDALCCLSTGSAFSTRTLYTTKDETLITVKRPVILNGIPSMATRGDLASRCISITLEGIPPAKRRTRKDIEQSFDEILPGVLGALFDATSCALRRQAEVRLPGMTRMADFCEWVTAAEPSLEQEPGAFMAAYERRMDESVDAIIGSSVIGDPLYKLLGSRSEAWVGTSTELLVGLEAHRGSRRTPRGWPDSPQKASVQLRRIAPALRRKGIEVVEPEKGSNPRLFTIGPLPASERNAHARGQARTGAGRNPTGGPKSGHSRASAPSALVCRTPDVEPDETFPDNQGLGWEE